MTNFCVRCARTDPMDRMVTIVNPWHNGPNWIDVCQDCLKLGDRVVGPDDVDEDAEWWDDEVGPDSAQEQLERGPR